MTQERDFQSPVEPSSGGDILLVGQSPLPVELRSYSRSGFLSVEIRMDPAAGSAKDVSCQELTPVAVTLLEELLEGRRLDTAWDDCRNSLQRRYFGPQKDALLHALEEVRRQFITWSKSTGGTDRWVAPPVVDTPSPIAGSMGSGSNSSHRSDGSNSTATVTQSWSKGHHSMATLLVTLLAHSRLLDGKEWRQPAGVPLSADVRRQAVQLYAVVQQILHSVEAEPGLLQPQIEPIQLQPLVERALRRSTILGHHLAVNTLLSTEPLAARGDRVVLEEALVMLFDEIASYTASAEASLEITADKRRTDILLILELRDDRAAPPTSEEDESSVSNPTTLIEQMWKCGLGTLAARTLVEHQGGRLWMQESFPKELPSLCLALPAQQPQEEAGQPQGEAPGSLPTLSSRPTRVTALWR